MAVLNLIAKHKKKTTTIEYTVCPVYLENATTPYEHDM